jgi:8-hydroxy-5-deazaflavin:NADPH oxidoreductase
MNLTIIGAGNVGKALAGAAGRAGHDVTLSAAHPESARRAAEETGSKSEATNRDAVAGADIVFLAVPYGSLIGILDELEDALDGKVVVDVTNPLKADYSGLATEGTSAAEQVKERVPGARVVKALNTVFAARQANPSEGGTPLDGFVASDDEEAKATVLEFVRSIGLHPIDAGPLEMARALEAMALLNIMLQLRNNWSWQTGWKLVGPKEAAGAQSAAA